MSTPPAALNLIDLLRSDFRASASADALNLRLQNELGLDFRYQPARLALALSLSDSRAPEPVEAAGRPIRGETLFSPEQGELATWVGLFSEHAGRALTTRRELQEAVAAHWSRGADLLSRRWATWPGSPATFIADLAAADGPTA